MKCNNANPCTHCSRLQKDCVRAKKRYRFSKPKRLDASLGFSDDQTWVVTRNSGSLSFVDIDPQTAQGRKRARQSQAREPDVDVDADRPPNDHDEGCEATNAGNGNGMEEGNGMADADIEYSTPEPIQSTFIPPPSYESLARPASQTGNTSAPVEPHISLTPTLSAPSYSALSPNAQSDNTHSFMQAPSQGWRQQALSVPSPYWHGTHAMPVHHYAISPLDAVLQNSAPSTALRGLPEGFTDTSYLQLQEACLMRHYVEQLSPGVRAPYNKSYVLIDASVLPCLDSY